MSRLDTLLSRPDAPSGPSQHALRRLVAGDLSGDEEAELRHAVAQSPELAQRVAALRGEDEAFLAARPFDAVKAELFARAGQQPATDPVDRSASGLFGPFLRPRSLLWAIAATVTALGLMVAMPEPSRDGAPPTPSGNRLKGGAALQAFQDVGGRAVALESGATLEAGDVVQFRVASAKGFIALLGVDGTGTVSRYLPVGGDLSAARAAGVHPLSDALVLDDAPGPEVFLAFLSDEPLLVEDLERAVHDVIDAQGVAGVPEHPWAGDVGVFVAHKEATAP